MKKSVVDEMQGENPLESAAYTGVREHFERIFDAAGHRHGLFVGLLRVDGGAGRP